MKKTLSTFVFLFSILRLFSQEEEYLDSRKMEKICMNSLFQLFSISESIPKKNTYLTSCCENAKQEALTIKVETLNETYFEMSNWQLKSDTITSVSKMGDTIQEILKGKDLILGNKLIIQNKTDVSITLQTEDENIVMIQEALDRNGTWRPVEYFIHSDCGVSYKTVEIPPHYQFEILIAKYCGEFKTKMRVRISLNVKIYISDEYDGFINFGQFECKPIFKDLNYLKN